MSEEFEAFSKISRLNREIVITEKIDGTNAQIFIGDDGKTIKAGSRTKWLAPGKATDNFNFAAWVEQNKEELLKLGPGRHYGEWWGVGIQRRYGLQEKRFSLFNTSRWSDPAVRPACVGVVPVLYTGPWTTNDYLDAFAGVDNLMFAPAAILYKLKADGSKAAPGFMDPEGIVVFHAASGQLFKATCKNDESHKSMEAE